MTKCNKCGYEWESKSQLRFVSCPSCLSKVEVIRPSKAESPNDHNEKGGTK